MSHPEGARVRVNHFRRAVGAELTAPAYVLRQLGFEPDGRGGVTVVSVQTSDGRESIGVARCADTDNFSRRRGRDIALGRALDGLV